MIKKNDERTAVIDIVGKQNITLNSGGKILVATFAFPYACMSQYSLSL